MARLSARYNCNFGRPNGSLADTDKYSSLRSTLRAEADACVADGDLSGACDYLRDLLTIESGCFGDADRRTLTTRVDLANQLYAAGNIDAAQEHYSRALGSFRAVAGENDPSVLVLEFTQAQHLLREGELAKAKAILLRITEISRRVCGSSNAATLLYSDSLAATLFRLGEMEAAQKLISELLLLRLTSSSANDCAATLATASAAVTRLLEFEGWKQALPIQESIVGLLRHVRGEKDLDTLRETWLLGMVVLELGEVRRARQLLQSIVTPFSRLLGRAHPETLRAFSFLAALIAGQGEDVYARAILERSQDAALEANASTEILLRLSDELRALERMSRCRAADAAVSFQRHSGNIRGRIRGEIPFSDEEVAARLLALQLAFWKQ